MYQNLWDTAKRLLEEVVLNAFVTKRKLKKMRGAFHLGDQSHKKSKTKDKISDKIVNQK